MTWRWISEREGVRPPDPTRPPGWRDWLLLAVLTMLGVTAAAVVWRQPAPLVGKLLYEAALVFALVQPWRFELRRIDRYRVVRRRLIATVALVVSWSPRRLRVRHGLRGPLRRRSSPSWRRQEHRNSKRRSARGP
jgi:hypothetical protein